MGRQAYLTRLALGRSAFEPPLRNEHGEFILGPHANEDSAKGYIQQFNASGHPLNVQSEVAARRFRRAQNEVQAIAGILERKNKIALLQQKLAKKNNEKVEDLQQESHIARVIQFLCTPLLSAGIWWIVAFRRRLLTQYDADLVSQLRSDLGIYGIKNFLFSGFLAKAVASVGGIVRSNLITSDDKLVLYAPAGTWTKFFQTSNLQVWTLDLIAFSVQWPLLAASDLQALQLIRTLKLPSPKPLLSLAYIRLTNITGSSINPTFHSILRTGLACLQSPFVFAYLRDVIQTYIRVIIFKIVRHFSTKPDRPDNSSIEAAESMRIENYLVAGLGQQLTTTTHKRYYGPRTYSEVLEALYPNAFNLWCTITGTSASSQPGQLTPFNEAEIIADCDAHYRRLRLADDAAGWSTLRHRAVHAAFEDHNIDPRAEGINVDDWAMYITEWSPAPEASPSPQEVIEPLDLNAGPIRTNARETIVEPWQTDHPVDSIDVFSTIENQRSPSTNLVDGELTTPERLTSTTPVADHNTLDASFSPTVPLEALLNTVPVEGHLLPANPPQTPLPGLVRTVSFPQTHPRPVRRPTDIDGLFESEDNNAESGRQTSRRARTFEEEQKHRVTILSNFPAEAVAVLSSVVLTDLILLPLDVYYFRLLARTFLQTEGLHSSSLLGLEMKVLTGSGLLGLRGAGFRSVMRYSSSILLTYAIQIGVSSVLWRGVKGLALQLGRYYGWQSPKDS